MDTFDKFASLIVEPTEEKLNLCRADDRLKKYLAHLDWEDVQPLANLIKRFLIMSHAANANRLNIDRLLSASANIAGLNEAEFVASFKRKSVKRCIDPADEIAK